MDYLAELQKIEKQNQEAKINKAKLDERLESLKKEHQNLKNQLDELGIKEEDLSKTIENLRNDIENSLDECKAIFNE